MKQPIFNIKVKNTCILIYIFTTTLKLHNFSLWNGKMAEKPQNYQIIMVFSTILKKTFATEKKKE